MSSQRIRIVLTHEEGTQVVGFIKISDQQIVAGQVTPPERGDAKHTTYHSNGYIHTKLFPGSSNTTITPKFYGPKISEFSGYVVIGQGHMAPSPDAMKLVSPEFVNKDTGFDSVTHIDNRSSEYGTDWRYFVCEPGFPMLEMVNRVIQKRDDLDSNVSVQVFTGTNPWCGVISAHSPSPLLDLPRATPNFRRIIDMRSAEISDGDKNSCTNGVVGCDGPEGKREICKDCYDNISKTK